MTIKELKYLKESENNIVYKLVDEGKLESEGNGRFTSYSIKENE